MDHSLRVYEGGNPLVESDYVIAANTFVPMCTSIFLGGLSGTSPDTNPLYQRPEAITKLNPQLILVGAAEFALQDSKEWALLCKQANIKHEMVVEWAQMHIYAMGSKFVDPVVRRKTDDKILGWIRECIESKE